MENALENQLVLSTLFKCFSVEELRSVRLVSKLWLQESVPTWRARTVVRIREGYVRRVERREEDSYYYFKDANDDDDDDGQDSKCHLKQQRTPVNEFLDHVVTASSSEMSTGTGTPSWTPFRNFTISLSSYSDVFLKSARFWEVCGPHIKYLHVENYYQRHCADLRDILLGPKTPLLETIVLKSYFTFGEYEDRCSDIDVVNTADYALKPKVKAVKFRWRVPARRTGGRELSEGRDAVDNNAQSSSGNSNLPFRLEEMFRCFNNLEKVDINLEVRMAASLAPLRTLEEFKNQGMLRKLQHLSLTGDLQDYDDDGAKGLLRFLGETKSVTLHSLKLGFGNERQQAVPTVDYYPLLDRHKDSLTFLDIAKFGTPTAEGLFPPGMIFRWLETLVISSEQYGRMEFLANVPNLKTLHVVGYVYYHEPFCHEPGDEYYHDGTLAEDEATKKEYLRFGQNMSTPNEEEDHHLVICHNLKELVCKRVCTLKELLQMTKQMPNLEELELPMENCAFQLVCQKWTKLRSLAVLQHPLGGVTDAGILGYWDSPWPSSVPPASIKNLNDLRCLVLGCHSHLANCYYPYKNHFLTVISLYEGIFKLPRLRVLKIIAKLSESQKEELFRRVSSCVLFSKERNTYGTGDWRSETNIWCEGFSKLNH